MRPMAAVAAAFAALAVVTGGAILISSSLAPPPIPDTPEGRGYRVFLNAGCAYCHERVGGVRLEGVRDRIARRLADPEYWRQWEHREGSGALYRWQRSKKAIDALRALSGEARIREWFRLHVRNPRFDNPDAQMPAVPIPAESLEMLVDYLMSLRERP